MSIIVKTPRFIIRNFLPEEEEMYIKLLLDPEVALYLPQRNRDQHKQIFKTTLDEYATGNALGKWGIFNITDDDFIGMCLLRYFDESGSVEIGYSLHKKYWGKGIATDMAKALVTYGFNQTNTNEIVAVTALENIGSQRVLQKVGLQRDGNINQYNDELAYFRLPRTSL